MPETPDWREQAALAFIGHAGTTLGALEAALDVAEREIRADERERIRQLATEHDAYNTRRITSDSAGLGVVEQCDLPFADLLRGDDL